MRYLNFFFIPVVQESLNEISPTIYGPNKPKTSGKPLRILDLQPPAAYHDKPATLYICVDMLELPHQGMKSFSWSVWESVLISAVPREAMVCH